MLYLSRENCHRKYIYILVTKKENIQYNNLFILLKKLEILVIVSHMLLTLLHTTYMIKAFEKNCFWLGLLVLVSVIFVFHF